jgi:hypothetical protein
MMQIVADSVGEVLITKDKHAGADEFWCQITKGDVGVGDLIVAYEPDGKRRILGAIVSRENYSESDTASQYLESQMLPLGQAVRPEVIRVAKVKPLIQDPLAGLPPSDRWPIRLLTDEDADLLSKNIPEQQRVLVGFVPSPSLIPVYAHAEFILGREGAHVNISGKTGLATKTNYAVFLAYSILAWAIRNEVTTAIIMFNVKRGDLMRLHKIPTRDELPNALEEWSKRVGLEHRVEVIEKMWDFALKEGLNPWNIPIHYFTYQEDPLYDQLQEDMERLEEEGGEPSIDVSLYSYALKDLELSDLIAALYGPRGEVQETQLNMLSAYWDEVVKGQSVSFDDMLRHFKSYSMVDPRAEPKRLTPEAQELLNQLKSEGALLPDWHPAVAGAIFRRLDAFLKRSGKIIDRGSKGQASPIKFEAIKPYRIHVIQLYGLDDSAKRMLVNALLREVQEGLMKEEGVKRVSIFIDELNQYAPKRESIIKEQIIDIAARGRDLCLSLIGAQQFASDVDHEVYDNCSTKVVGRTDEAELEAEIYRYLRDFKSIVPDLPKGEMMIYHATYKSPLHITFPVQLYELEGGLQ